MPHRVGRDFRRRRRFYRELRRLLGYRDYLKQEQPDLWAWFSSDEYRGEQADAVRLELLKSTVRLGTQADEAQRWLFRTTALSRSAHRPGKKSRNAFSSWEPP